METNEKVLTQFSETLAGAVSYAGRSVVRVEARRRGNASGIAWSPDGLVVTAHHGVERDHDLRVGLPDGGVVAAELVGRDPTTDVALLRADAELHPPQWVAADTLRVGYLVLSVGRHDERVQASLGVVHHLDGPWRTRLGGRVDTYVQTDIVVYPGFSGSALVDAEGRVAGMNTPWFGRRSSLTLPRATLERVVGALREHGRVRRGMLGVGVQPVRLPGAVREALERRVGLLTVAVEPSSAADEAGVLVGDLLVALDGEAVASVDDLLALLTEERIGRTVPLELVRGGQLQSVEVTIGEQR